MAGQVIIGLEQDQKRYENALVLELTKRIVSQGIVDSASGVVVRDILPLTDLGGSTTGSTSASYGYTSEIWRADLRTYQQDGSTAVAANAYNTVVNVDLKQNKVIGVLGVAKRGNEDPVSVVKFSLSSTKIKDVWDIESVHSGGDNEKGEIYWAENPMIYNGTNTMKVDFYLKSPAIVYHRLVGKTAEPRGNVILGTE